MQNDRLAQQVRFILEVDKLKSIFRQSLLTDRSRQENDAEHSWHLALMAVVLAEHAEGSIDLLRVLKMLLVHDAVEIDAGDTFLYDAVANADKTERENRAAARIFGLLPAEQRDELTALWREFEERATPEARFAAAMDRLEPLLLNYHTGGAGWQKHGIVLEQVLEKNRTMAEGSRVLWDYAQGLLAEAVRRGYLGTRR